MSLVEQVRQAFFALYEREDGNLRQVALRSGVDYAILHRLKVGKSAFEKMSIQTLEKLFPQMRVTLLPGEDTGNGVFVHGANHGVITNGNNARSSVCEFPIVAHTKSWRSQTDSINRSMLENQILHAEELSSDERIKFLLFIKDNVR